MSPEYDGESTTKAGHAAAEAGTGGTGGTGGYTVAALDQLKEDLLLRSVRRGSFVLKSSRASSWFIDAKQSLCRPPGLLIAAGLVLDRLAGIEGGVDSIGGLTMGADPVAFTTAALAAGRGFGLKVFSVRKEEKDHGPGGRIAGVLEADDRVVVVEDVATRGTSLLEAVRVVRAIGALPILALAVVDRGGTAAGLLAAVGVPFEALLTAADLGFSPND